MAIKDFEKRIRHLKQMEVLAGSISSLNKLLVDKHLVSEDDLQAYFMKWLRARRRAQRKRRASKERRRNQ